MRKSVADAVSKFKRNWTSILSRNGIEEVCKEAGLVWRERVLTPAHTIELFLLQVLHGNTAISHLRMFSRWDFTSSAYCQARKKIPLEVFQTLLERMSTGVRRAKRSTGLWLGRRVFLLDGSSFSMSDTSALQERFGQPSGQKEGCGFPVAYFVALFHAGTGMVTKIFTGPMFSHDLPNAVKLHAALRRHDVVVGDRGFCSYVHLALMARRGVDAVFRVHQKQHVSFRKRRPCGSKGQPESRWEKTLGTKDQLVTWFKPKGPPSWLSDEQFRLLPSTLSLRELAYRVNIPGFRTKEITLVTTLLDSKQFTSAALSELDGQRWSIETNFCHLKTTMGMEVLHCKTVAGVLRELYAYCLV